MRSEMFGPIQIHEEQRRIWEAEHAEPFMFPFVDASVPTDAVKFFGKWLASVVEKLDNLEGLEMCCGKARNAIWLAAQGARMCAFDFSDKAIDQAKDRLRRSGLEDRVDLSVHDAVEPWPYPSMRFDFVVDCFGSSDIESEAGRVIARDQAMRVLKPGGYIFVVSASAEQGYHAERRRAAPGPDRNTVLLPNGKLETVMSESDIRAFFAQSEIVYMKPVLMNDLTICGEPADCLVYWTIVKKVESSV